MVKINVNWKYDLVRNNRRIRVVDRKNGAVVVDFIAPHDTPVELGDALKQAVLSFAVGGDAPKQESAASKKKKTKKPTSSELAEELEVETQTDE
jgi:hypothetical protein